MTLNSLQFTYLFKKLTKQEEGTISNYSKNELTKIQLHTFT